MCHYFGTILITDRPLQNIQAQPCMQCMQGYSLLKIQAIPHPCPTQTAIPHLPAITCRPLLCLSPNRPHPPLEGFFPALTKALRHARMTLTSSRLNWPCHTTPQTIQCPCIRACSMKNNPAHNVHCPLYPNPFYSASGNTALSHGQGMQLGDIHNDCFTIPFACVPMFTRMETSRP